MTHPGLKSVLWLAAVLALGSPASAQEEADDPAADLDTLLAPVALFPDPLLAAVLQASVVPLDVVMAARFLDDYAKDPATTPDAGWDPAVRGLLAFPSVLKGMNEHLDWMQSLGDAVTGQLPAVQDAIQQDRAEFHAAGVLKSDDRQRVEVDGDVIRVTPADPKQIFVPIYDPQELVATIQAAHAEAAAKAPAAESGPPPVVSAAPAIAEPAATPPPPAPAPRASAPPPTPAVAEAAPPPPAPEPAPPPEQPAVAYAAPPAYAPAPVYAAPVTYAAPVAYPPPAQSTTSSAGAIVGSFAGGALVGGLLGYAIGDDDDDHHHHGWGSDLDEDDLDDVVDRIDDDRDDARHSRQDFAKDSREDRQEHQSDMARQGQDARLQRERFRQHASADAQAQLSSRAQRRPGRPAITATRRAAPSPAAIQAAAPARRPMAAFRQSGTARAGAASLPRTASVTATRVRASDRAAAPRQETALSNLQRGATTRQQELRGARSRQQVARPAAEPRAIARPAQPPVIQRPAFAGLGENRAQPFVRAGGGQVHAFAERGRASRRR